MNQLQQKSIASEWFFWHFSKAPRLLTLAWINFLEFSLDYFSILTLLQTLFSPWHRLTFGYPKGFNITEFFSSFISNIFSRFIGAICRAMLIFSGILFFAGVFLAGLLVLLLWILLPFLFIVSIMFLFI